LSEGTNTQSEAAILLSFLTHARVRQPNTCTAFNVISAVTSTPILLLARHSVLEASSCPIAPVVAEQLIKLTWVQRMKPKDLNSSDPSNF